MEECTVFEAVAVLIENMIDQYCGLACMAGGQLTTREKDQMVVLREAAEILRELKIGM